MHSVFKRGLTRRGHLTANMKKEKVSNIQKCMMIIHTSV